MDFKDFKEKARNSMKGKLDECAKILIISFGISFVVELIIFLVGKTFKINAEIFNMLSVIVSFIITAIFGFGMISFFLKMSRNEEVTYKELFAKIGLTLPYIIITLATGLFTFLWSLLFIIPGIIAAISYSFATFIFLDNPEMNAFDTLQESKKLLQGHKMEYFLLMLSFIGWIILGMFTLGILYIWLIPYMSLTECHFYNYLKEKKN